MNIVKTPARTRKPARAPASVAPNAADIRITAVGDLTLVGSVANTDGDIALSAGGDTAISVVQDLDYDYLQRVKKKRFSKTTRTREILNTTNVGELLAGGDITLNSQIDEEGKLLKGDSGRVDISASALSAGGRAVVAGDGINVTHQKTTAYHKETKRKKALLA